tara:strand:+ start:16 stop:711 length:696 start_codon:yes stop_codon:yes gene_type:complete
MVTNGIYKDVYLICWRGFDLFTLRENIHRIMSMKKTLVTFFIVLFFINASIGWSETWDELEEREGIYYKKSLDVPFDGEATGKVFEKFTGKYDGSFEKGSFKKGKKQGLWVYRYDYMEFEHKGNYKNGLKEGSWVSYYYNGKLYFKGNYKNGNHEGIWKYYHNNGQLHSKGKYKNGRREGYWVAYFNDGNIHEKGEFKNGNREGHHVTYDTEGIIWKEWTGFYKNDIKISD